MRYSILTQLRPRFTLHNMQQQFLEDKKLFWYATLYWTSCACENMFLVWMIYCRFVCVSCDVFCYLDTNVCTYLQSKSSCCDYRSIIAKTYSYDVYKYPIFPSLAKLYWFFPLLTVLKYYQYKLEVFCIYRLAVTSHVQNILLIQQRKIVIFLVEFICIIMNFLIRWSFYLVLKCPMSFWFFYPSLDLSRSLSLSLSLSLSVHIYMHSQFIYPSSVSRYLTWNFKEQVHIWSLKCCIPINS